MTEPRAPKTGHFSKCQWIDDDPIHESGRKCERPTLTGSPYCPAHHEQAYVRKKAKPEEMVGGDT
jgi:hypothetical protein